jgi:hypothetical protein
MFHVGQKVVCVDDSLSELRDLNEILPTRGTVYTIRAIVRRGSLCFHLVEITNEPYRYQDGFGEVSFKAYRFRPVVERKTDISIFTAMLTPSKADA